MVEKYISSYIYKITKKDIRDFSIKSDIILNDQEINVIYKFIKNNWKDVIYSDHSKVLISIKDKLNNSNYQKIENLITFYKDKYKNYL